VNPDVDKWLDLWLKEPDEKKQIEYLQKVEDMLSSDLPLIPLYRVPWVNVVSGNVGGTDIPIGRWVFWDPLVDTYFVQTPTPTPTPALDLMPIIVAVVIIVVIIGLATYLFIKRRKK
jgi:hypothetical protein